MNKKVTIKEIADKANVSIATVSRITSGNGFVSDKTKKNVYAAMHELNFKSKILYPLNKEKSNVILLCIPDFINPFNACIIEGAQNSASTNGYNILVFQLNENNKNYADIMTNMPIAGTLILSPISDKHILDKVALNCPIVMCSEHDEDYSFSYVTIEDAAAAKKAVSHLISTGCKKIGMLNSNMNFKYSRHRENGYLEALESAGLEINPDWIVHISSINYSFALSQAKHILSLPNRPDALFASSDVFAICAIRAAGQLNLRVPEDVSIIGFDNTDLALICDPALTTIKQPSFEIGYQACEMLIEKIKKPHTIKKSIILDTELIIRSSTRI